MTVSTIDNVIEYVSGGPAFPIPYRFLQNSDIEAVLVRQSGVSETLVLGTQYTLTGAGSQSGGTLTSAYAAGVLATPGATLTISRVMDAVQPTDLRNQGRFLAETHETVFDRLTMLIQQAFGILRRALLMPIGKNYYDAKGRLIKNLGDGQADQDAVNIRTMRDYVDAAIAGVVGGFGWFIQSGTGAIYRTFQSKMRDVVSVKDFGAVDGGVVDCTFAFVATENAIKEKGGEAKAYVPLGTYLVDTTVIDIGRFYGDGYILTTAGVRIAMQPFRDQTSLVQAKLMVPNFGFDNGTIDTSVYSGARNALQGISIVEVGGVTKLFMSQRVAGGAWTSTTRCRIIECDLVTDGSTVPVVTFSGLLNIGHGIDLTARVEGGVVYLYSSQPVDPAFPNELAGKGYSRIRWRGNATTQADVQSYTLWGQVGSGHRLEKYNRACVKISDDGKWLIMASSPISAGAKRQILVYDFQEVTAAANKLNTRPKIITEYSLPSEQNSNVLQGIMSDGRTLTINMGGTVTLSPNYITDIGFDGTESLLQEYEGALDQYGLSGILNNSTQGHPWRFEPEGICSYKGGRVVSIAEGWYESARIVTWEGLRWACITPSDTTGVPPSNGSYWVRTTKAATDGAWDAGVNYANTSNFSHEVKTIYYVGPSLGLPQERPLTTGINNRPDPSQVPTGQGAGATSAGFQWRNSFTVRAWAAALGRYFDAFWYDNSSRFRIYDAQEGSDNTVFASIQALFTSSIKALILRGRGTSAASSALLRLHDRNDPSYPGYIIESTREDGSFSRETNGQGATRFAASSGSTPITACRPDDGMMYGFEKNRGESLWGLYRGQGSPEGNVTAPRGSLYVVSTGATNTLYVKESGSGNTGWVGK